MLGAAATMASMSAPFTTTAALEGRPKTRILIADDHPIVRRGFHDVLAEEAHLEGIGAVAARAGPGGGRAAPRRGPGRPALWKAGRGGLRREALRPRRGGGRHPHRRRRP